MIALNAAQFVRDAIAEHIGVKEIGDGTFTVDIPWSFPDGDQCRVFISKTPDGKWNATDGGSTVMRASYAADVDVLEKGYVERFRQIVSLYGLSEDEGDLWAGETDDLGAAVFSVAQASIDIVHLSRLPKEPKIPEKSRFAEKLAKLIESAVPADRLQKNWTDDKDEDGLYRVPYRVDPSRGQPLFVFGVNSQLSCVHATISCLHHRPNRKFRAAAIYDQVARLPKHDAARLNDTVDESFASLAERDDIKKFLDAAIR